MNITRLKYFIAIVEEGSISKAATSLNMTQPPLSIAIKKFEEELGFDLFKRLKRKMILTAPGKIIYEQGKELIHSSNAIIEEAKEEEKGETGHITIGCSTVANLTIIPLVMQKMQEKNINITLKVLEGNTDFILKQLRTHKMDLGFIRNIIHKEDFNTTTLLYEPLYVALPPNHPLSAKKKISLKELKDEKFLMPYTTLGFGVAEFILEGCDSFGFKPNVIYWGTETLPMIDMVNRGLGIAFVPSLFKEITNYSLPTLVKLRNPEIRASLNLATLKNSVKKTATERFINITKEVIVNYDMSPH